LQDFDFYEDPDQEFGDLVVWTYKNIPPVYIERIGIILNGQ